MKRSTSRRARRAATGYTLLELMIVLAILSVLTAVSWPLLRRPLNRSRLQDGAQQLSKVLMGVRLQAMAESRAYVFRYQAGAATYHWCPAELLWRDNQHSGSAPLPRDAQPEPAAASSAGNYFVPTDDQQLPGDPLRNSDSPDDGDLLGTGGSPGDGNPLGHLESLPAGTRFSDPQPTADSLLPDAGLDSTRGLIESVPVNPPEELANALSVDGLDSALWSEPVLFYPDGRGTSAKLALVGDNGYEVDVNVRGLTGTVRVGPLRRAKALPWEQEQSQSPDQQQGPALQPQPAASAAQASR